MPPITLAPWREAARKIAQALKRQIAQTEHDVASFLRPGGRALQREPVPLPRHHGGTAQDRLRQRVAQGARRNFTSQAGPLRPSLGSRGHGALSAQVKAQFGRAMTRPTTQGTLRAHGYRRGFATSTVNHAQIAREVFDSISLGLRAGVLHAPFFGVPDGQEMCAGRVVAGLKANEHITTVLTIPVAPKVLAPSAGLLNASLVAAVDEAVLSAPRHLAKLRRTLYRLSQRGDFAYKLVHQDSAIQIAFPGRDRESVERFLDDVLDNHGSAMGALQEVPRFLSDGMDEEVDWHSHLYAKKHDMTRSQLSLERYIQELDEFRAAQVVC